ncbi:MAG: BPL-N domain-containing protein [Verrucomicrobiota bacterium]
MRSLLAPLLFSLGLLAAQPAPIRVAVYDDKGATGKGIPAVEKILGASKDFEVTKLKGPDFTADNLRRFDLVMFTGGSGSAEAEGLGVAGREEVRKFVREGGGYVGICAGAYLACTGFDWGLGVLNARTVSNKWRRGTGDLRIAPAEGDSVLSLPMAERAVRYNNGPVIKPDARKDLPPYKALALFKTEVAENGTPVGVMVGSLAFASGDYGLGRVFISSPHPEQTAGLEPLVIQAVRWSARRAGPADELWKRLEAMDVEKLWLPGAIVDWKTGLPTGQPFTDSPKRHTHCSQFVAAASFRLGVPLLRPPEHSPVGLASAQNDWLDSGAGRKAGWVRLRDGAEAQSLANEGRLVLASVKNPDPKRAGHIAIVRPGNKDAAALASEGPDIMQAGGTNFFRTSLKRGFANHPKEYDQIAFHAHVVELTEPK